jgi:hypothetical protein
MVFLLVKGETVELCKWTVDIGSLPSFQENASMPSQNGFYTGALKQACVLLVGPHDESNFGSTDFELGLELDGAEVRGILQYEGREWGRVIFDMLS